MDPNERASQESTESDSASAPALPKRPPRRPRTACASFVKNHYKQVAVDSQAQSPKDVLRDDWAKCGENGRKNSKSRIEK